MESKASRRVYTCLQRLFSFSSGREVASIRADLVREREEVATLFRELKRAEKVRIDFVANVSHELRTPLTSIKGYSDTLREDLAAGRLEMAPKFLDVIDRNVNRLIDLIDDLLDLSKLESEESADPTASSLNRTSIDLRDMTEKVLQQLESKIKKKRHTVQYRIEAREVQGDPKRIEQVLVNLLENAIKYVPYGGEIEVAWTSEEREVQLAVIDNGPGIPAANLPRLFERFYRIDQGRSRESGGTGLGLAIVKHIMQRHGGTVSVRSQLGKGTEFICVFPDSDPSG